MYQFYFQVSWKNVQWSDEVVLIILCSYTQNWNELDPSCRNFRGTEVLEEEVKMTLSCNTNWFITSLYEYHYVSTIQLFFVLLQLKAPNMFHGKIAFNSSCRNLLEYSTQNLVMYITQSSTCTSVFCLYTIRTFISIFTKFRAITTWIITLAKIVKRFRGKNYTLSTLVNKIVFFVRPIEVRIFFLSLIHTFVDARVSF